MTIKRVETGVIQFGDDYPGTFIRGDNSFSYANNLRYFLSVMKPYIKSDNFDVGAQIRYKNLQGLLELLDRSNIQNSNHEVDNILTLKETNE